MARRSIVAVCLDNLDKLPKGCRTCSYWETAEEAVGETLTDGGLAKEHWYDTTLRAWGPCGRLLCQGPQLLGYSQYAPPAFFPQLQFYPIGRAVDQSAVFISCLYIPPSLRGRGLGKVLLQAVQKNLFRRGYRAIETLALHAGGRSPAGWTEFYLANGFQIIQQAGNLTLLRLDLKAAVSWQENVEAVLESLVVPLPGKMKVPIPS